MPSAQQLGTNDPSKERMGGVTPDLHSLLREIHASKISNLNSLHPRGKVLFAEGEPARGVYILRAGRIAVSISSSEGRVVILRTAQAGDVLGLNPALRNAAYDTTVKTLGPCRTDFISRADLIELMENSKTASQAILTMLSHELTELTNRARLLLLPQTALGRLARLLLEWSKESEADHARVARIERVFTQEEIAQLIGSSRETVTRLLATLGRREIIRVSSDSILIRDGAALETIAHST